MIEIPKRADIKQSEEGSLKLKYGRGGPMASPLCPFAHSPFIQFLKMIIMILYTSTQIHLGNNTHYDNTQPHIIFHFVPTFLKAQNLKRHVSSHSPAPHFAQQHFLISSISSWHHSSSHLGWLSQP